MAETNKRCRSKARTSIGGQAVLEGVMMRGSTAMVTAVRDQDNIIRTESKRIKQNKKCKVLLKIPIVRGIISFVQSLVAGTKVLLRSAEVYGESEPTRFEKWLSEKLKLNVMSVITTMSVLIAFALSVGLFIWLPQFIRERLEIWFSINFSVWAKNFIEGGFKLTIFISYIVLCALLKDVKRTFMYHGAEHKTITCYENGLDLTVENAKQCSRVHDRCGTTFLVFVMLISILTACVAESLIGTSVEKLWRVLLKLALLPVVAGLSYELLKALSKTDCFLVFPLKLPGMLLQRITTREPDDKMLEVAITAFKKVLEMDSDSSIPETEFVVAKKRAELVKQVKEELSKNGITEQSESEWIVSIMLGVKRNELYTDTIVSPKKIDEINQIVKQRITGRPLWYCIGDTEFYGYKINVDERVLIPRPETELLVYNALNVINENSSVLDMCTGSGAIAIAVKKEKNAMVTAVDKSVSAISLAKENAKLNGAEIEFVESDMFSALENKKYDVIISNPPYIKSLDINSLQREVKDFEPLIALDGGEDGYDFYKIIANDAKKHLVSGGSLFLECGENQAKTISELLIGFHSVEIIKDYENIDRIIKAVL